MQQAPPPPRAARSTRFPRRVDAIITRCLEPDPAKRFQTTTELQAALDRLDDNGKPLPIIRRVTRRTMAVAAVLVLLLLGGTFYATRQLTAPPTEHDPVTRADRGLPEHHERSDLRPHARPDAEARTGVCELHHRLRPQPECAPPSACRRRRTSTKWRRVSSRSSRVSAWSSPGRSPLAAAATTSRSRRPQPMTGNVITSVTRRASNKDQVLAAVTRVVTSVRNALGDETSDSAQQLAMKTISTTSLDVASHYAAAVNAQSRGNAEEALASFAKAVQLDPKFGLGYQGLAVMSRNLGRLQDAEKYAKRGAPVSRRDDRARTVCDARLLLHSNGRLSAVRQGIRRADRPIPG